MRRGDHRPPHAQLATFNTQPSRVERCALKALKVERWTERFVEDNDLER